MSIGSISSTSAAAALEAARLDATRISGDRRTQSASAATIAQAVEAADARDPIRSLSATQGTLLDTYM